MTNARRFAVACALMLFAAAQAYAADEEKPLLLDDGYVHDWLALAPVQFSLNPNALSPNAYVEFLEGESAWLPREGYPLKSGKTLATNPLQWKKHSIKERSAPLAKLGGRPQSVVYAVVYIVAPKDMDAMADLRCNKSTFMFLRGQATGSGAIKLKAGYNSFLIRMADKEGDGSLELRITDKNRKADPALVAALIPAAETEEKRSQSKLMADPAFILFPKSPDRVSFVRGVMTPEAKAASDKALDFILKSQQANGAWSDLPNYPDSVGVTALCCLSLMAEGNLPKQGPHGKALDKGIEFLLNSFTSDGVCVSKTVEGYGPMYGHSLATLVLLEICGNIPWHPEIEDRISKALQKIEEVQRPDGGWRYEMSKTGESDISVTTVILWVLGQARKYGYTVPRECMDRAIKFIEQCSSPDGRFRYRLNGIAKIEPHSGIGTAALYGVGKIDFPVLPKARELISFEYKRYSVDDLAARRYLLFGSFFVSLAFYSSTYDEWKTWYTKMAQIITKLQQSDGEMFDQAGNKVYTTALAAIILQSPYEYLSIYQR